MQYLFLKKVGMTQVFDEAGACVPVTVLQKEECRVVGLKDVAKNGYKAYCVGYGKASPRMNKPRKGLFEAAKQEPTRYIREVRATNDLPEIGTDLSVSIFASGDMVDVRAVSKGKGFAGGMKRHNFAGLRASHGVSVSHRSLGSTGNCQDPGRVWKGKKMAGQMGNKFVTVQNLVVFGVREEDGVVMIKGSVPGPRGEYVRVRTAVKGSQ